MDTSHLFDVSVNHLNTLLCSAGESSYLDFKSSIDLSSTIDTAELAKDVAAFSDQGGWMVIGVSDSGVVVGVPESESSLWDESKISDKLLRYLEPGFRLAIKSHPCLAVSVSVPMIVSPTSRVVIIHVLPHPGGACITRATANKSSTKHGKTRTDTIFRESEIFTRRGTKSIRINQEDLSRILDKRSIMASNQDTAARNAIAAAEQLFEPLPRNYYGPDRLSIRMGWAASSRPIDTARRLHYDHGFGSFTEFMDSTLEGRHVRRDGHYYATSNRRTPDSMSSFGTLTHPGVPEASISVTAHAEGWISIAIEEDVADWEPDAAIGWWTFGASSVAFILAKRLGLSGTLYSCLHIPKFKDSPSWEPDILDIRRITENFDSISDYQSFAGPESQAVYEQTVPRRRDPNSTPTEFDPLRAHRAQMNQWRLSIPEPSWGTQLRIRSLSKLRSWTR